MNRREALLVLGLAAGLMGIYGRLVTHEPALVDEYVYLAGARHLSEAGSLDARFYTWDKILTQGHPHHDDHAPGYVILLAVPHLLGLRGYGAAVALNALACAMASLLIWSLARSLGASRRGRLLAVLLFLLFPPHLAYVFWAMPEVLLSTLFLAALWTATRFGDRLAGAAGAALAFFAAFLVRESALFGLPAVLILVSGWKRVLTFLATFVLLVVSIFVPLSRDRAEGGANLWAPTSGRAFAFETVQAGASGHVETVVAKLVERARWNLDELLKPEVTHAERGILVLFALIACASTPALRSTGGRSRGSLAALLAGLVLITSVVFGVYVAGQWSGLRYVAFLVPPLIPFLVRDSESWPGRWGVATVAAFAAAGLLLTAGTRGVFDQYKTVRQARQRGLTDYAEHYMTGEGQTRVVLGNGMLYGLENYPIEVITGAPEEIEDLMILEDAVWFDYVAVPTDRLWARRLMKRKRYEHVNADDPNAEQLIFRRVR